MISCFKCGECCRKEQILLTNKELELIKTITGHSFEVEKAQNNKYLSKNSCPFLKENFCSIYEIRPCQCRLYHCGRVNESDFPLKFLSNIKELMSVNSEYKIFREEMEKEAIEWGNKHGWNWKKADVNK